MANTYSQILVQVIFAVKGRNSIIKEVNRNAVEKYICGIISKNKSKMLAIYCNPDHCHILIGLHPAVSISDLVRAIKSNSSKWINANKMVKGRFSWQDGFGAFTYSRSQLNSVVNYILNQPLHHQKRTFRDEYVTFLKKFEIEFDRKYVFDFYEN